MKAARMIGGLVLLAVLTSLTVISFYFMIVINKIELVQWLCNVNYNKISRFIIFNNEIINRFIASPSCWQCPCSEEQQDSRLR